MIEADILMRGHDPKEPIMAHPPDNDSDITLREWLQGTKSHNKGIKLDFKRSVVTFLCVVSSVGQVTLNYRCCIRLSFFSFPIPP